MERTVHVITKDAHGLYHLRAMAIHPKGYYYPTEIVITATCDNELVVGKFYHITHSPRPDEQYVYHVLGVVPARI